MEQFDKKSSNNITKNKIITDYIRISITDKCNLQCKYCVPQNNFTRHHHSEVLRDEEFIEILTVLKEFGITKARYTGGEPLVRKSITHLMNETINLGIETSITTNGLTLEKELETFKKIGVKRLNISLDTLDRDKFKEITGVDGLDKVISSIKKASEMGFKPLKINTVLMRGINHLEIDNFISFAKENDLNIRFIEFMPGEGLYNSKEYYISSEEILKTLDHETEMTHLETWGPAVNYRLKDSKVIISFISPVSDHFCKSCSRIRLSSLGELRLCLFGKSQVNLKDYLRSENYTRAGLKKVIENVISKKESFIREGGNDITSNDLTPLKMSGIGG